MPAPTKTTVGDNVTAVGIRNDLDLAIWYDSAKSRPKIIARPNSADLIGGQDVARVAAVGKARN